MGKVAGESAQSITWWQHFPSLKDEEYGRDWKTLLRTKGLRDGSCSCHFFYFILPLSSFPLHTYSVIKIQVQILLPNSILLPLWGLQPLESSALLWFYFFWNITILNSKTFMNILDGFCVIYSCRIVPLNHIWSYKLSSETSCTLWSPVY